MNTTFFQLESRLKEKTTLRDEYTRSIKNPQWFAPRTLTAFRKTRAKLNKEIASLKNEIKHHPDNPKKLKSNGKTQR